MSEETTMKETAMKNETTRKNETMRSDEDAAMQEQPSSVLGQTSVLAQYFSQLFGTRDWGETVEPPVYASGPVPACAGSLAQRRLADPEARFHFAVMMAEAALLPLCVAHSAAEKESLKIEIAQIVGLDVAVQMQWIEGYVICWRAGRFPTSPTGIRVRTAPGRRSREQVLGSLEPHIRRFVKHSLAGPYDPVHILNARKIG